MPSGPGAFLFGRCLIRSLMSEGETSWEILCFSWYSLSWTCSRSERLACTSGGKNFATRIAAFSWNSAVGGSWTVLLSGGSWGRGFAFPALFLAHFERRQRSPVLRALFEACVTNSRHAWVESWRSWFLIWF